MPKNKQPPKGKQKRFVKFSEERLAQYKNAGYRIVGKNKHTGIEICRWTKSAIKGKKNCYKDAYGIESHRCVQMTPTLDFCTFSCGFCWRKFGKDRFKAENCWDLPKEIVDEALRSQRKLLTGFGGNPNAKKELWEQSKKPAHFAISLDGEPTLYPHIAGLIKEIKKRGMTAFLVTNGTMPHKLKEMIEKKAEPTNIYISVYATNKKDYRKITNPFIKDEFEKVLESLALLKRFREARTIFRITAVKGANMKNPEEYAKLIKMSGPDFVELKGYAWLGSSRQRLERENVPSAEEVEQFANEIIKNTGYKIKAKDKSSRVVIMAKNDSVWKSRKEGIREKQNKK